MRKSVMMTALTHVVVRSGDGTKTGHTMVQHEAEIDRGDPSKGTVQIVDLWGHVCWPHDEFLKDGSGLVCAGPQRPCLDPCQPQNL